jgi:hypothetical protein
VLYAGANTATEWDDPYTERGAAELTGRIVRELFVSKPISKAVLKDHLRAAKPAWFEAEDVAASTRRARLHAAGVSAEKAGYLVAQGSGCVPGPTLPPEPDTLLPEASTTLEGL